MSIFLKPACSCSRNDQCCQLWIIHDWLLVITKLYDNIRTSLTFGICLLNIQLRTLNSFIKWRGSFTENFYQKKSFSHCQDFRLASHVFVWLLKEALCSSKKISKKKRSKKQRNFWRNSQFMPLVLVVAEPQWYVKKNMRTPRILAKSNRHMFKNDSAASKMSFGRFLLMLKNINHMPKRILELFTFVRRTLKYNFWRTIEYASVWLSLTEKPHIIVEGGTLSKTA